MLKRRRNVDRDDAKRLVRAAWSIERFRKLSPILAAEELLENPCCSAGDELTGPKEHGPVAPCRSTALAWLPADATALFNLSGVTPNFFDQCGTGRRNEAPRVQGLMAELLSRNAATASGGVSEFLCVRRLVELALG